jgi:hypothetical protein
MASEHTADTGGSEFEPLLCDGDHQFDPPPARWVGTMPDSISLDALCFLCQNCANQAGKEMAAEGWEFEDISHSQSGRSEGESHG